MIALTNDDDEAAAHRVAIDVDAFLETLQWAEAATPRGSVVAQEIKEERPTPPTQPPAMQTAPTQPPATQPPSSKALGKRKMPRECSAEQ